MAYFAQGFWIFIGIVVGIIVNIITQKFLLWRSEIQLIKNFKFELNYNIKKIEIFEKYIRRLRDLVNGDNLYNFVDYFDLTKIIFNSANQLYYSGLLYKYLDNESVGRFLDTSSRFNQGWETLINSQVNDHKIKFITNNNYSKKEAVNLIDFWEKFFSDHKKVLQDLLKLLELKNRS